MARTAPTQESTIRSIWTSAVIIAFMIGGFGGYFIGTSLSKVTVEANVPVITTGEPEKGVYPRYTETGLVEWNQVDEKYPQVRAYEAAFADQFPQFADEYDPNAVGFEPRSSGQAAVTFCFALGDLMQPGDEAIDHIWLDEENPEVEKQVANLAIDIICPEFIEYRY